MHRLIPICLLALCIAGCANPLRPKTLAAHRYSLDAIAFLDQPGTTREDVTSNLGPPMVDTRNPDAFIYGWRQTSRLIFIPRYWGLFIAFDAQGRVSKHEIRELRDADLETACQKWALATAPK